MLFFLPEGLDDEGDALQANGEDLKPKEQEQQLEDAVSNGIHLTAQARAVAGQSLQVTSSQPDNHFK